MNRLPVRILELAPYLEEFGVARLYRTARTLTAGLANNFIDGLPPGISALGSPLKCIIIAAPIKWLIPPTRNALNGQIALEQGADSAVRDDGNRPGGFVGFGDR